MLEHLTQEQINEYQRGTLPPVELLEADDHLHECANCRATADAAPETINTLLAAFGLDEANAAQHLAYEQIAALVDDSLGEVERDIALSHLVDCGPCAAEVRELSAFRVALETEANMPDAAQVSATVLAKAALEPEMIFGEKTAAEPEIIDHKAVAAPHPPVIHVTPPVQVGFGGKRRGWWARLRARLSTPSDWSFLEAGALATVALAVVAGLAWYARSTDQDRQTAQVTQPPTGNVPLSPPPIVPLTMDNGTTAPTDGSAMPGATPFVYPSGVPPLPQTSGGSPLVLPPLPSGPPPSVGTAPAVVPLPPASGSVAPLPLPPLEASYIAQLKDGANGITLNKQGQMTGTEGLAPDAQDAVKEALEKQKVQVTPLPADLGGAGGVLMSGKSSPDTGVPFALMGPVRKILRADRPIFRWQAVPKAQTYTVTVSDQNFNVVASSGAIKGTTWQPSKSLPRGGTYSWQVKADIPDAQPVISPVAPAPEARFKVLEADQAQILDQAQRQYGKAHLILGIFYARAGLVEEAEQEFKALLNANPDSPIARNLLKEIQQARK